MATNALHKALGAPSAPQFVSVAQVAALIAENPEYLMEKNKSGRTPFFYAIERRVRLEVIQALLDACPDAVLECDQNGDLPVQYLLRGGPSVTEWQRPSHKIRYDSAYVRALIVANPACLKLREEKDGLPLHLAVGTSVDDETFYLILQGYPEACGIMDGYSPLPLDRALANDVEFEVIEALVRAFPTALDSMSGSGFRFHYICKEYADALTETFISFVKEAVPMEFIVRDDDGCVPLHHVLLCELEFGAAVVIAMINAYPEAARVRNRAGELALHCSLELKDPDVVAALVDAYPEALTNWSESIAETPFHVMLQDRATYSLEFVLSLVRRLPTWVLENDDVNSEIENPLQTAASDRSIPTEFVRMLYQEWPGSVMRKDSLGRLPLAVAAIDGSQETLEFLLELYPEATRIKDNDDMPPLHHALGCSRWGLDNYATGLSEAFVRASSLIDAWPESLQERNPTGKLPLHLLLSHIRLSNGHVLGGKRKRDNTVEEQLQIVGLLVSRCPESVEVVDGEGNIPLISAGKNDEVSLDVIDLLVKASLNVLLASNRRRRAVLP